MLNEGKKSGEFLEVVFDCSMNYLFLFLNNNVENEYCYYNKIFSIYFSFLNERFRNYYYFNRNCSLFLVFFLMNYSFKCEEFYKMILLLFCFIEILDFWIVLRN